MTLTVITFGPCFWSPVPGSNRRRKLTAERAVNLNGVLPVGLESDGMSVPWGVRLTWDDPGTSDTRTERGCTTGCWSFRLAARST
jgi:hypothetical protein